MLVCCKWQDNKIDEIHIHLNFVYVTRPAKMDQVGTNYI